MFTDKSIPSAGPCPHRSASDVRRAHLVRFPVTRKPHVHRTSIQTKGRSATKGATTDAHRSRGRSCASCTLHTPHHYGRTPLVQGRAMRTSLPFRRPDTTGMSSCHACCAALPPAHVRCMHASARTPKRASAVCRPPSPAHIAHVAHKGVRMR
jgi:hypothetical protein